MTTVTVKVEGLDSVQRMLRYYGREAESALDQELAATAQEARNSAVRGIQRGPKTGRVYPPVSGRRGSSHRASSPGEYPATDTGTLVRSVAAVKERGGWAVGSSIPYSRHLEFGTQKMRPRPWLVRSVREAVDGFGRRLGVRLRRIGLVRR